MGCSPVQSKRLSLVAKSVKYNWGYEQKWVSKYEQKKNKQPKMNDVWKIKLYEELYSQKGLSHHYIHD